MITLNATLATASTAADLTGKIALVTGALGGIGLTCAQALARAGAFVWVSGRKPEQGAELVRQLTEAGGKADYVNIDVMVEADWAAAAKVIEQRSGRIDILVNNAGNLERSPLEDTPLERILYMARLNIEGAFLGTSYCWSLLKKARGIVFNMNSTGGQHATPTGLPYSSSKGGMLGLSRAAAADGLKHGIRSISLHPGSTWTPGMARVYGESIEIFRQRVAESGMPLKRPVETADIAAAVVFLSSDRARHITGVEFTIDGGLIAR